MKHLNLFYEKKRKSKKFKQKHTENKIQISLFTNERYKKCKVIKIPWDYMGKGVLHNLTDEPF